MIVILIVGTITNGFEIIILYYSKNNLKVTDSYASLIIACSGIGLFVGSLFILYLKKWDKGRTYMVSLTLILIGLLLFFIPNKYVLLIAQFLFSIGMFSYSVSKDILIQDSVPNEMMGRVGGLIRMVSHITVSISAALLGWIANTFGIETDFGFSSFLILLIIVLGIQGSLKLYKREVVPNEQTKNF